MEGSSIQTRAEALQGASETRLIPLACRARASKQGVNGFVDEESERLVERLGVDLDRYAANRATLIGVVHRGSVFDQRRRDFLSRHPRGTVLNLGAGLNSAFERIRATAEGGGWSWMDTGLEPVIGMRVQLFDDDARRSTRPLDASDSEAVRSVLAEMRGAVLVLSKAVLIYLKPEPVGDVFKTLAGRGDAEVVFDWVSPETKHNSGRHPAIRRLKDESVVFASSLRRASDIRTCDPRWRSVAQSSAPVTQSGFSPAVMAAVFSLITFGRRYYGCAHARLV